MSGPGPSSEWFRTVIYLNETTPACDGFHFRPARKITIFLRESMRQKGKSYRGCTPTVAADALLYVVRASPSFLLHLSFRYSTIAFIRAETTGLDLINISDASKVPSTLTAKCIQPNYFLSSKTGYIWLLLKANTLMKMKMLSGRWSGYG